MKEDTQSWRSFVSSLIPRGPAGVRMVTGETARRTRPDATTPYRKRTEHRAHDRQKQFAQDSGHYHSAAFLTPNDTVAIQSLGSVYGEGHHVKQ